MQVGSGKRRKLGNVFPKMKHKPLSREFLLKRGYCCNNKCKNCPYRKKKGANKRLPSRK